MNLIELHQLAFPVPSSKAIQVLLALVVAPIRNQEHLQDEIDALQFISHNREADHTPMLFFIVLDDWIDQQWELLGDDQRRSLIPMIKLGRMMKVRKFDINSLYDDLCEKMTSFDIDTIIAPFYKMTDHEIAIFNDPSQMLYSGFWNASGFCDSLYPIIYEDLAVCHDLTGDEKFLHLKKRLLEICLQFEFDLLNSMVRINDQNETRRLCIEAMNLLQLIKINNVYILRLLSYTRNLLLTSLKAGYRELTHEDVLW